ncbi:MAG: DNA polymerase/3'-5' exonuclease PolX, partial [Phycisphaerae bacterium]
GFGKKTQEAILQELARIGAAGKRILLNRAKEFCEPLLKYLKKAEGVKDVAAAGSYRRRRETVGDLDILIIASKQSDIAERVCNYEDVKKVIAKGKSKTSVLLGSDLQVDVRVVPQVSFGAAMVYFTGSKEHCIALRKIGQSKKLKVNEYGVYKGKRRVAGRTEQEVYKKLGLEYIEPELRENRGEIEAAKENNLPKLIKREDIRGDFHVHSNYTDGHNTIEEMAEAARELGYKYIAITDHSQNVTVAGGLKPREVEKQIAEIDKLNKKLKGITILKGSEVDILEKGDLDLPDEILEQLDIVVCSVHSHLKLSRDKQTKRIIKAMDNPNFNILGHPTGRLINERGPYDVDMEAVVKAAAERGVMLELNSHFDRLDLDDMNCKMAKDNGVMIVISTDAHRTGHFDFMEFGIGQARRGWLEAKDILNTRPLAEVKKILKRS